MHPTESDETLFEELFLVAALLHKDMLRLHYGHSSGELTRLHFGTLGTLSAYERLGASELAEKMQMSKPQMSVLLDKLEANGLVCRVPDAEDRRRVLISLTPDGKSALNQATASMRESLTRKLAVLDKVELVELSQCLKQLARILKKLPQEPA